MKKNYVLIVEDELEIRTLLKEILTLKGIPVLEAQSGNQAIKFLNRYTVVAILTDIKMKDGNGIELLESIRKSGIRTPVVFISASGERHHLKSAIQLGAFDFIEKPFSAAQVIRVTEAAIETGLKNIAIEFELLMNVPSERQNEAILKNLEEIAILSVKRAKPHDPHQ